jgi:putative FmdB family regulatory protein
MPIYEYLCPECACKFELLRSVSGANEDASCPKCRHKAKRVFSRFASFSKGADGESTPIAGSSSCSGCTSSSCSSCHI